MSHHLRTATFVLALALTAGAASCGAEAPRSQVSAIPTAYGRTVAAADAFAGRIVRATGRLAGDHAIVRIDLHVGGGSRTRRVRVALSSPPCHGARHCLSLTGTLKGTLIQTSNLPDRGRSFAITASGTLKPFPRATVTGTVTGTGNIRFGRESLALTVSTREGKLLLAAQSGQVPGFTSP